MNRNSRIYIQNFGYADAYIDQLMLDMRSEKTGAIQDTIVFLMNSGGKTSIQSFYFSVFPDENYRGRGWLNEVQSKGANKKDIFFAKDEMAVIAIEWEVALAADSGRQSLFEEAQEITEKRIAALAVKAVQKEGRVEFRNIYFGFKATDELSIESLPLRAFTNEPIETFEGLRKWCAACKADSNLYMTDFIWTESPKVWREYLESWGCDMVLIDLLYRMNAREGGNDQSLEGEKDFLTQFIEMGMSGGRLGELGATIETIINEQKKAPARRRLEAIYNDLEAHFHNLAHACQDYSLFASQLQEITAAISSHNGCLAAMKKHCLSQIRELNNLSQKEEKRQARLALKREINEHKLLEAEYAGRLIRKSNAIAALKATEAEIDQLTLALKALNLASIEREIAGLSETIRQLASACENSCEMRNLRQAATLYNAGLLRELDLNSRLIADRKAKIEATSATQASEKARIEKIRADLAGFESEIGRITEKIRTAGKRREALVASGVLDRHSDPQACEAGLKAELEQITNRLSFLDNETKNIAPRLAELEAVIRTETESLAILKSEVASLQTDYAQGVHSRKELVASTVLLEYMAGQEIIPDNADLLRDLGRMIHDREDQANRAIARLSEIEAQIHDIEMRGVASQWQETEKALAALRREQIDSANAGFRYIAENTDDEVAARAIALADPGKYMGIVIGSESDWARLPEILPKLVALSSFPIEISRVSPDSLSTAPHMPDKLVLAPANDALWNRKSAKAEKERLERGLIEAQAESQRQNEDIARFKATYSALAAYQEKWPGGPNQTALAAKRIALAQMEKRVERDNNEKSALLNRQREAAQERLECECEKIKHNFALTSLDEFIRDFPDLPGIERQLAQLGAERDKGAAAIQAYDQYQQETYELIGSLRAELAQLTGKNMEYTGRIAELQIYVNTSFHLEPGERSLEDLHKDYERANGNLAVSSARLDLEMHRHELARKTYQAAQAKASFKDPQTLESLISEFRERLQVTPASELERDLAQKIEVLAEKQNEIKLEARAAAAEMKKFSSEHKEINLSGTEFGSLAPQIVANAKRTAEARARGLASLERKSERIAKEACDNMDMLNGYLKDIDSELRIMRASLADLATPPCPAQISAAYIGNTLPVIRNELERLLVARANAQRDLDAKRSLAESECGASREIVNRNRSFLEKDDDGQWLVQAYEAWTVQAQLSQAQKSYENIQQIHESVLNSVHKLKGELDRKVRDCARFMREAAALVVDACAITIPETEGTIKMAIAGERILTSKIARKGADVYEPLIARDFEKLISDPAGFKAKGIAFFVAKILREAAGGDPRLRIIKLDGAHGFEYTSADKIGGSGAQRFLSIMLLCMLFGKLHEKRSGAKSAGISIIMDNPYANLATRTLLDALLETARHFGQHLVFFTGVSDRNLLDGLPRVIVLNKSKRGTGNKQYITINSVTDFQQRPA